MDTIKRAWDFLSGGIADIKKILCSKTYRVTFGPKRAWELADLFMPEQDEIEVSIGTDGAKVALKGAVATQAGRGLADLFKPFVQWVGEKGDAIQHERNLRQQVRIFNEEALCKGLLKASEIADQSGVAIQPVSLKFLAQWSEGVSLEEPKDDSLLDLWAKLLASESLGQGRNSLVFIDILKKLDRSHAEYMSGMFAGNAHMLTESNDYFGEMAYEDFIVSKLRESGLPEKNPSDEDEVIKSLYDALRLPGTYNFALYVNEVRDEKKELELAVPPVDIDFNSRPVSMHSTISDVLEALGLIEKFHHEFPWHSPQRNFEISVYSKKLTPLGWEFVLSCGVIKLEQNEARSNE